MEKADINKSLIFYKGIEFEFPDFTLEYIGTRNADMPQYVNKAFTYHDYKLKSVLEEKVLSWTSGTGLLNPISFTVNNIEYEFAPYEVPTKVVKTKYFKDTEIFAFVLNISLDESIKLYPLKPVLRNAHLPNHFFYSFDPETNIKSIVDSMRMVGPGLLDLSTLHSPCAFLLPLAKPLSFLNSKNDLFYILRDRINVLPLDSEIFSVGFNSRMLF